MSIDEYEEPSYEQVLKQAKQAADEWATKWPNHCKCCGGWGGKSFIEMHGFKGGGGEQMFDLCEHLPEHQCHRCGTEHAMREDGEGPCEVCGWKYDDGMPEVSF